MTAYRKKLIEVALPLKAINEASAREKSIRHGHPSTLHLWWSRKPLATARAVLFAQLVDDPSAWPDLFPTEEAQERERQRLFGVIERMVTWAASNDEAILNEARREIARNWARSNPSAKASRVLAKDAKPDEVNAYLETELPPVHDPFAGGGTIPLEAQRLGLRAIATDLNPVAVLINKALIEIPPRFAGMAPVNPESRKKAGLRTWRGTQGLAEDVRYYGAWMRDEARKRIGHLYPDVEITPGMTRDRPDLRGLEGQKLTIIAWLWARTVASPNPALGGVHVPLVSSFWLSTKEGKKTWVEPVVDRDGRSYRFEIGMGIPKDESVIEAGTKLGRGANFRCIISGTPIEPDYIKAEGVARRMDARLMAIVAEGRTRRLYLPPTDEMETVAKGAGPAWIPDEAFAKNSRHMTPWAYGLTTFGDLFTRRQLALLGTLSDVVQSVQLRVATDAETVDPIRGQQPLPGGGSSTRAYGEAVSTYLTFAVDKVTEASSTLCSWSSATKNELVVSTFRRQALPMTWDFAETNPFADSSGSIVGVSEYVTKVVAWLPAEGNGSASQLDASAVTDRGAQIVSTDPPYYDNVPYADLSDFFYVWLRRTLRNVFPELLSTITVPKGPELVADSFRHGGKDAAEAFFFAGMTKAMGSIRLSAHGSVPVTVYYAFKQSETDADSATSSTGWETFLQAMVDAGFSITGTWPMRSERAGRMRDISSNALASSVVLVCRKRDPDATAITRGDFRRALRTELPSALRALQHGNIAPVDVAQASIGPGMAIFSRHAKVLEADGSAMTVRSALQLINEALDEYLSAEEGEADADTRFAITWFGANAWAAGSYGDAETLAKARNVSVAGIAEAGVLHSAAGKVRLLKRGELPEDWDPSKDGRLTVWEATQHLIKRLEERGEPAAASLLKKLGPVADHARGLSYRLYNTCERKGWAEDARAYNGLVIAWPELEKLAANDTTSPVQLGLGLHSDEGPTAKKRARRARKGKP